MPSCSRAATRLLAHLNVADGATRRGGNPIPLAGERMRITIRGGLAVVSRRQTFRNAEQTSIEATLTFPVPVHATLNHLSALIDGRSLAARAEPRARARGTYEKAVDEGKTAVLHEELMRGIHMLSVAHIPPGAEVVVTHEWIGVLSPRGAGQALLRIPVTLGDVYGDSPLSDADDLVVSADVVHEAEIEIDPGQAEAAIAGHSLVDGKARLRLDAPIDVIVRGSLAGTIRGVAADGRPVAVSVVADGGGDASIDAAILVDRSSSMEQRASGSAGSSAGRP